MVLLQLQGEGPEEADGFTSITKTAHEGTAHPAFKWKGAAMKDKQGKETRKMCQEGKKMRGCADGCWRNQHCRQYFRFTF